MENGADEGQKAKGRDNVPMPHRGTMPPKPAFIRRTESPTGASPDSRSVRRACPTNLRNIQHRRRGRISDDIHIGPIGDPMVWQSISLPVYQSTSLPIYQPTCLPAYLSTSLPASDVRPLRGRSFLCWTFRRFVGQALLVYGY